MSGSTHTVQMALGPRQVGAAILAVGLAIVLAVVLVLGPLAAETPQAAPVAAPPAAPVAAPQIVTPELHPGTGGHRQQRIAQ
jgi:hypothetical protein